MSYQYWNKQDKETLQALWNIYSFKTSLNCKEKNLIQVFLDKEIWRISVRLSDRSEVTQHKINFPKNCPQKGLNQQPPDHHSNGLPMELGRNLLEIPEVSFLFFFAPLQMLDFVYFWNHRAWLCNGLNIFEVRVYRESSPQRLYTTCFSGLECTTSFRMDSLTPFHKSV